MSRRNWPKSCGCALRGTAVLCKASWVILEESLTTGERLTADEVLRKTRKLGLRTRSESVAMIRADRDAR